MIQHFQLTSMTATQTRALMEEPARMEWIPIPVNVYQAMQELTVKVSKMEVITFFHDTLKLDDWGPIFFLRNELECSQISFFRPYLFHSFPFPIILLKFDLTVHCIVNWESNHLETQNILSPNQGGYQKAKSTLDSISGLVDNILINRNKGNITLASFIDIKKAFDSVNYLILLKKNWKNTV